MLLKSENLSERLNIMLLQNKLIYVCMNSIFPIQLDAQVSCFIHKYT